jgi:hypothetical protein
MPERVAPTYRPVHAPTEWREGASERQPSLTAWRSFIDARIERRQHLLNHVVTKPALGTSDRAGVEGLRR